MKFRTIALRIMLAIAMTAIFMMGGLFGLGMIVGIKAGSVEITLMSLVFMLIMFLLMQDLHDLW